MPFVGKRDSSTQLEIDGDRKILKPCIMVTYKCRVELSIDIERFMSAHTKINNNDIIIRTVSINPFIGIPESIWEFDCNTRYSLLTAYMLEIDREIGDLHIMIESMKPSLEYNGERDNRFVPIYRML